MHHAEIISTHRRRECNAGSTVVKPSSPRQVKATPLKKIALNDGQSTELVEAVLPISFNRFRFRSELFKNAFTATEETSAPITA